MTKTQIQKMMASIERREKALAKERDKLDDIIADLEQLRDDCREASDCLFCARDALSRLL